MLIAPQLMLSTCINNSSVTHKVESFIR